jgi:hypothetical protein
LHRSILFWIPKDPREFRSMHWKDTSSHRVPFREERILLQGLLIPVHVGSFHPRMKGSDEHISTRSSIRGWRILSGYVPSFLVRGPRRKGLRPSFSTASLAFHLSREKGSGFVWRFLQHDILLNLRGGSGFLHVTGNGSRLCRNLCSICRGMWRSKSL